MVVCDFIDEENRCVKMATGCESLRPHYLCSAQHYLAYPYRRKQTQNNKLSRDVFQPKRVKPIDRNVKVEHIDDVMLCVFHHKQ